VAPGAVEAATAHIKTLIPRLRVTLAQRSTANMEMARLLDELRLAQLLLELQPWRQTRRSELDVGHSNVFALLGCTASRRRRSSARAA